MYSIITHFSLCCEEEKEKEQKRQRQRQKVDHTYFANMTATNAKQKMTTARTQSVIPHITLCLLLSCSGSLCCVINSTRPGMNANNAIPNIAQ